MDINNIEVELNEYDNFIGDKLKTGETVDMVDLAVKFTKICSLVLKLKVAFKDCIKKGDAESITKVSELQQLASSVSSKFDIIASQV